MLFLILLIPKVAKIKIKINSHFGVYRVSPCILSQLITVITNLEINYCTNFTALIPCRSIQRIMAIFSGVES